MLIRGCGSREMLETIKRSYTEENQVMVISTAMVLSSVFLMSNVLRLEGSAV